MPLTISEVMQAMPGAFIPDKAEGLDVVIQFHITGEQSGDWIAAIKNGECTVKEGTTDDPTMALTADGQDYVDVVTGKLNGMEAFMQGKIRLKGDLNLAMKLTDLFEINARE